MGGGRGGSVVSVLLCGRFRCPVGPASSASPAGPASPIGPAVPLSHQSLRPISPACPIGAVIPPVQRVLPARSVPLSRYRGPANPTAPRVRPVPSMRPVLPVRPLPSICRSRPFDGFARLAGPTCPTDPARPTSSVNLRVPPVLLVLPVRQVPRVRVVPSACRSRPSDWIRRPACSACPAGPAVRLVLRF